jgi:hypothetical protein
VFSGSYQTETVPVWRSPYVIINFRYCSHIHTGRFANIFKLKFHKSESSNVLSIPVPNDRHFGDWKYGSSS